LSMIGASPPGSTGLELLATAPTNGCPDPRRDWIGRVL